MAHRKDSTESIEQAVARLNRPEASDALFDTSPEGMTRHFAGRLVGAMRAGEHAAGFARMAASFAFRVRPDLRERPKVIGRITPEAPWGDATVCYVSDADYQQHWKPR